MEKIRMSQRQWVVPLEDGFVLGRRTAVLRRIRGGPELGEILTVLAERLGECPESTEHLCALMAERFQPELVRDAIQQFLGLGILESCGDGEALRGREVDLPGELYQFLREQTDAPEVCLERLRRARVVVAGRGRLAELMTGSLEESGISGAVVLAPAEPANGNGNEWNDPSILDRLQDTEGIDFLVGCADDPVERMRLFPLLNEACLAARRPWLAVSLDGDQVLLGPLFIPGETGCYRCLELREESQLPHRAEFLAFKRQMVGRWTPVAADSPPPAARVASAAASLETMRIISRVSFPTTYQTLVALDLRSFESESHCLLRVPFCDVCGPHLTRPFRTVWNV